MTKRLAGYIRVSRMRDNDPGLSPENQKEKIILQAKMLGVPEENIDFYIDLDYSGKDTNRPEFQKMLSNLNLYSYVIVYKLTRFSRSVSDFHINIKKLEKAGVELISVTEMLNTSTNVGRLIRNILIDFGEFERENIAEQVRDNMHQNASQGNWCGGRIPYGFDWTDKQLVANDKMDNVQYIYEASAKGIGTNTIRNYFAAHGILSPTGKAKWSKNTIMGIIRSPLYKGQLRYGDKTHEGKHGQYISDYLWDKANAAMDVRSDRAPRSLGSQHLLSGLIKCSECGRNLHVRNNGNALHPIRRYVCPNRNEYVNGDRCSCLVVDADSVEAAVVSKILEHAYDVSAANESFEKYKAIAIAGQPDLNAQKKQLRIRLKAIKSDMSEMFKAYRAKAITIEQLTEENAVLLQDEKAVNDEMNFIEQRERYSLTIDDEIERAKKLLNDIKNVWEAAAPDERKEIIGILIKSIKLITTGVEVDCTYFTMLIEFKEKTKTTLMF